MFNVNRYHPQIGIEDGGGAPYVPPKAIQPTLPKVTSIGDLAMAYPGFHEAWKRHAHKSLDPNEIIAEVIKDLADRAKPREKKYFYIEKISSEFFVTKEGESVIFITDGKAKLQIRDNGVEYKYKIPGATITCESWKEDLLIRSILLDSGGSVTQIYIPDDDPLLGFLKVRRSVADTPTMRPKPQSPNRPTVLVT